MACTSMVDVTAVIDAAAVQYGGLLSAGDSACSIPPQTIAQECLDTIREWTPRLARALNTVGLINIQYVVQDNKVSLDTPLGLTYGAVTAAVSFELLRNGNALAGTCVTVYADVQGCLPKLPHQSSKAPPRPHHICLDLGMEVRYRWIPITTWSRHWWQGTGRRRSGHIPPHVSVSRAVWAVLAKRASTLSFMHAPTCLWVL